MDAASLPENYSPVLTLKQTEQAIKLVKDFFEHNLSAELRLSRVTSPLFVPRGSGINDDLNGIERPVRFPVKQLGEAEMEVVQSLAKWKRMALADYGYPQGKGLYTDMNALRPDDDIDAIHSIYVDQWDWELVMRPEDRKRSFLMSVVSRIYEVLKRTEFVVSEQYPSIVPILPETITILHAEDALQQYPDLTPQERERELAREHGAVFIMGIGGPLSDGIPHGGRAPDYDDWTTGTEDGLTGLNGDIIVWNPVREDSMELSSMGIRVNEESLLRQLALTDQEARKDLFWHRRLLSGEFPQTIGGGIGQSRLCMFFLRKAHIGEVQASVWPEETIAACKVQGVPLM
ncbi:aspartate--ammonia ligase [Breznakiella homolactica]|uniref:Aspartate--ammonia ligase n=1 Tax=Breznakiella homolactica TaxID=2798577 RepID=A0A7T7XRD0_9SPIR|nr:aspartate--ammonia ligase [Breznakiella homolactica]QQO11084.1 aspartate--ammonia ligase [Breznakiella homolactica]